jgi:hypothetical protein
MTREEAYEEIARLRRERASDAPRATQMDAIRRDDRDYEINDPRTRYTRSELRENALRSALDQRSEPRRFDDRVFSPSTPDEAMTSYPRPIRETRELTSEAVYFTPKAIGISVTTERAVEADPADRGFILWFPKACAQVVARSGNRYQLAIAKRMWDECEVEGLLALPDRTPIEA